MKYTYKDYVNWPDEERWELLDGEAYNMSPAPTTKHQRVVSNLHRIISVQLQNKPCIPFIAPTDVVLSEYNVVQPDIFVVCDKRKITEANIQGPPDLVIEVLSPATALKDKREKKQLYEKYTIGEYIIVNPIDYYAERFFLEKDGTYNKGEIFGYKDTLSLVSLKGVEIPLAEVFEVEKKVIRKPAPSDRCEE